MSPTVASVVAAIDALAPLARAAAWDPVGLQVGDGRAPVADAAVCHDVTESVVGFLERDPVDLLIAYHPLLFRPPASLVAGPTPAGRALRLWRAGVSVAAVHTAFDVARGGSADALAATLGLMNTKGFGPVWAADTAKFVVFVPERATDAVATAMAEAGAGEIGNYRECSFRIEGTGTFHADEGARPTVGRSGELNREPEVRIEMIAPKNRRNAVAEAIVSAHPYEEPAFDVYETHGNTGMLGRWGTPPRPVELGHYAAEVAEELQTPVRYAGDADALVATVAVAPGSGSSLIEGASIRADVLVTGDVSHHQARRALDLGLAVVDAGHVPTERPGLRALYAAVSEIVPETRDLTRFDPHPWRQP